jgi:putative hydrolase of the HAD superfamily
MTDEATAPPSVPERVETILLDAGGVLLNLDYAYMVRLIEARRHEATIEALSAAEATARTEIHRNVMQGNRVGDLWRDYFHSILGRAGIPPEDRDGIIDSLWEAHQRFGLWTVAVEGATDSLRVLKGRGFKLGVVSNAEGRVETDLMGAGFDGLLETVVDSHVVGVEKPDPAIFAIALERLEASPETTLFIGDVPSVDIVGARAAELTPILLDPHDLYTDWKVHRLQALSELPGWLDENQL